MAEVIQRYRNELHAPGDARYIVLACGELRDDGNWEGWLEFHPLDGTGVILHTGRETTQPDRIALSYWASGLEAVYLEGAFERAIQARKAET
jgi:hypothetical protein